MLNENVEEEVIFISPFSEMISPGSTMRKRKITYHKNPVKAEFEMGMIDFT